MTVLRIINSMLHGRAWQVVVPTSFFVWGSMTTQANRRSSCAWTKKALLLASNVKFGYSSVVYSISHSTIGYRFRNRWCIQGSEIVRTRSTTNERQSITPAPVSLQLVGDIRQHIDCSSAFIALWLLPVSAPNPRAAKLKCLISHQNYTGWG